MRVGVVRWMLKLGQVRRPSWVFRTLKERTRMDPAVNPNGGSETFNKPEPHNRTHVHRCSNMSDILPPEPQRFRETPAEANR